MNNKPNGVKREPLIYDTFAGFTRLVGIMSITSEELNYLIWRYCQESGNAVSALALQDETRVLEFDKKYKHLIPIGTLVNLVQKGILYTESELLVDHDGTLKKEDENRYFKDFNLMQALQVDKETFPETKAKGRFALENEVEDENFNDQLQNTDQLQQGQSSDGFIRTLKEFIKLEEIISCEWNPTNKDLLACGGRDSLVSILGIELPDENIKSKIELRHPFAPSASAGKTTNEITCLAWSPRGNEIVTGVENGELRLWNIEGRLQNIFNFHRCSIVAIKWNENATHFITTDVENVTILWNAITGTALQHSELREQSSTAESLGVDIEWIEHDKFVIPGPQGSLVVYQMDENKPIGKLLGHHGAIGVLEFNAQSRMLLSASDDHTLRIWRGGSCNSSNSFYGHTQSIVAASWIDDDKIISASMDGSVRVWSHHGNSLLAVNMADGVPIFAARLSGDKTKYAVGFLDGQLTIYDISQLISQLSSSVSPRPPVTIPIFGIFQNVKDANCVYDISWSQESDKIAVAYAKEGGSIIAL